MHFASFVHDVGMVFARRADCRPSLKEVYFLSFPISDLVAERRWHNYWNGPCCV